MHSGVSDPTDPFRNDAYPNSWTPPLNTSWRWGTDRIYGYVISIGWSSRVDIAISSVNLGGWFVLEPFISPALFEKYPTAIDEWTLSEAMRADTAGGGIDQLEQHYDTFIVSLSFLLTALSDLMSIILDRTRLC